VPGHVEEELRGYLECGILCFGFARALCTGCGQGFVVAFSCKGRGVCPFCNGRLLRRDSREPKAPLARHLADCLGETAGAGGGGISAAMPGVWRRHPADRVPPKPGPIRKIPTQNATAGGVGRFEKPTPDARGRSFRGPRLAHQPEDRCGSAIDLAILDPSSRTKCRRMIFGMCPSSK